MGPQYFRTTFGLLLSLFIVGCNPKTFVFFQTDRWNSMFIRIVGDEFETLSSGGVISTMGVGYVEDQDSLLLLHYQNSPRMKYQDSTTFVEKRDSGIELLVMNTTNDVLGLRVRYGSYQLENEGLYVVGIPGDTLRVKIPRDSATVWIGNNGFIPYKNEISRRGRYKLNLDFETYGVGWIRQAGTEIYPVSRRTSDSIFLKNHRDEEYGYMLRVKGSDNKRHLNIMEWYPGLKIQTQPLTQDELLVPPKRGLLQDN